MKKIYSLICAMTVTFCSVAQEQTTIENSIRKETYQPKSKVVSVVKNHKTLGGATNGRFDPSSSLPLAHQLTISGTTPNYGTYVGAVFVDSTVKSSFSSASVISAHHVGVTFDPKSIIFNLATTALPLVSSADPYVLDTVWIGGVYQRRKNNLDDTLIVQIVWGDTTNATVYGSWKYGAPLGGFGPWKTPKYTTVAGQPGNQIKVGAPVTNMLVIKHVLTKADSIYMTTSDYLPIVLNGASGQTIPANNIVSCGYSFNSAGTHTNGAISYASPSSSLPGTESGWADIEYDQSVPVWNTATDVSDGCKDFGSGKNSSYVIFKKGRYGLETPGGAFSTSARGAYAWGYWIDFSIRYTSSVGINELESNGAVLGQNVPNPFDGASTVTYKLAKDASAVSFVVTDVTGRIVSSEKVSAQAGTHTIKLGSYAAGVYYYTLNVDGKTATKKMIAQ
jgi:hypothetical protein